MGVTIIGVFILLAVFVGFPLWTLWERRTARR